MGAGLTTSIGLPKARRALTEGWWLVGEKKPLLGSRISEENCNILSTDLVCGSLVSFTSRALASLHFISPVKSYKPTSQKSR